MLSEIEEYKSHHFSLRANSVSNMGTSKKKKKKKKKKKSNSPYITTCCSNWFQENNSWLIQKQSLAYSVEGVDCRSTMALIIMLIIIFLE